MSMIIDLDRANIPMERSVKQREARLNAGAGGAALNAGSGVAAPPGAPSGTDEFYCGDTVELDDPDPPPKSTQPLLVMKVVMASEAQFRRDCTTGWAVLLLRGFCTEMSLQSS